MWGTVMRHLPLQPEWYQQRPSEEPKLLVVTRGPPSHWYVNGGQVENLDLNPILAVTRLYSSSLPCSGSIREGLILQKREVRTRLSQNPNVQAPAENHLSYQDPGRSRHERDKTINRYWHHDGTDVNSLTRIFKVAIINTFEQEIGVHLKQIKTENLSKIRESFHKEIRRLSKETEGIKKNQVKITEL